MVSVDNRNDNAIREEERIRREIVNNGEIRRAIRATEECEKAYQNMARQLREWADVIRVLEKNRKSTEGSVKHFIKVTERLLGENIDFVISSEYADNIVRDYDVNCVDNDEQWAALLRSIGDVDSCRALTMTKAAYKFATKSLASYESKLAGLRSRLSMSMGSTEAELDTAKRMVEKMAFAVEVLRKRKDVLVDINLKVRRSIDKFVARNRCDPQDTRELTDEERAALAGLI